MKRKEIKLLPILLGSDENAYGCARLFFDGYGIRPLVFCSRALPPTSYSRILTRRVIKDLDSPAVFRAVVEETLPLLKKTARALAVIPCSDYYAELVIRNRNLLSLYSETPTVSESLYKRFSDKAAFLGLCEEYGLPHPETVIMKAEELLASPLPFPLPLVIKPENSNSFSYLHLDMKERKKVYFCTGKREVYGTAESLISAGYRGKLIVQRYIPGSRALTVNAYCDSDSNVRVIGAAAPILEYRSPSLIGNYAALKTVKERTVCEAVCRFLKEIGYVGFVNFDLKFDEKRNEFLFLELNPRQGRSSYYMHTGGKDLMSAFVEDALEKVPFGGTHFSEDEGIWSNVSRRVLKRHTDTSTLNGMRIDSAITPLYDPSPMRLLALLKRELNSERLLKE